jgi:hypothetical protein
LHFNCPEFKEERGHLGTFGTFARFLPLFEDLDTVWSSDIDIPDSYLNPEILREAFGFCIHTPVCYGRKVWGRKYTILAGRMISRIRFPRYLLTRFLTKLLNGSLNEIIDAINRTNTRNKPSQSPYGTDELFLNSVFYNYLQKNVDSILIKKDYIADNLIAQIASEPDKELMTQYYRAPNKSSFIRMKELHRRYIPELIERYPCLNETLAILPSIKNSFVMTVFVSGREL